MLVSEEHSAAHVRMLIVADWGAAARSHLDVSALKQHVTHNSRAIVSHSHFVVCGIVCFE